MHLQDGSGAMWAFFLHPYFQQWRKLCFYVVYHRILQKHLIGISVALDLIFYQLSIHKRSRTLLLPLQSIFTTTILVVLVDHLGVFLELEDIKQLHQKA